MTDDVAARPILVWFRKDLRLSDNPALHAAVRTGRPIIPLYIADAQVSDMGAAPKWRLDLSLQNLAAMLADMGAKLIVREGDALAILTELIAQTGADTLHYGRDYTPSAIARDTAIKAALEPRGIQVTSHKSLVLFEPWTVQTQTGGFYRVYSPMWRAVRDVAVNEALPAPTALQSPADWPQSVSIASLGLSKAMNRGHDVVSAYTTVGEIAALAKLDQFIETRVAGYKEDRNFLAEDATSGLSENLAYGEISPRQMWHAGQAAMRDGAAGAEHFLKEIVWREFAYHLIYHTPHILERNWRDGWDAFPWSQDREDQIFAWKYGLTGVAVVDAAMRELYVTGRMHNRARMIVASYLTKHMLIDWRVGMEWFAETLIDWDPASNAMGWQWVAGCGPDAAPFFRIFNPDTQAEKFDPKQVYRDRFLGDGPEAKAFFQAIPRSVEIPLTPNQTPIVDLPFGRNRALDAYKTVSKPAA